MKRICTILSVLLCSLSAKAAMTPLPATVDREIFQVGHTWAWQYDEHDANANTWTPYFLETYRVTASRTHEIEIEMSSWSLQAPTPQAAVSHHKMIVDFRNCEKARKIPGFQGWTMKFFNRDETGRWQVVSNLHKNLAFTEKFNCNGTTAYQVLTEELAFNGQPFEAFTISREQGQGRRELTTYFSVGSELKGVAARKMFYPNGRYRSGLVSVGRN